MKNNLINPLTPSQHTAFKLWIVSSCIFFIVVLCALLFNTFNAYYLLSSLRNELRTIDSKAPQQMIEQKKELLKKIQELEQWHQKIAQWECNKKYHDYLLALSNSIPNDVMIMQLRFEKDDLFLEGATEKIESVLPFMHHLEKSNAYKNCTLMNVYASNDSKNLVNFLLKGKLIK